MWCSHESFLQVVKECWAQNVEGCPMFPISTKLKSLKKALQKWNVEVFGRVEAKIKALETRLLDLEQGVIKNYSQE